MAISSWSLWQTTDGEDKINSALAGEGETVSVDVRYDEADPENKVFKISSSSRGTAAQIDLDPGFHNFLTTIKISNYDSVFGLDCEI